MRNFVRFLIIILVTACSAGRRNVDPEIEDALESLDYAIDNSGIYSEIKIRRLDSLRRLIPFAGNDASLYNVYDKMFSEYNNWNCDSALFYAHRKEKLAEKLGLDSLINDSAEDIASRYIISAMYLNAMNIVIDTDKRTRNFFRDKPSREFLMYEIYHNLVISFNDKYSKSEHLEQEAMHLERAVGSIARDNIIYFNYLSKSMIASGECGELIIILQNRLAGSGLSVHDKAIVNYWLGKAYETLGDDKNAFLHYIMSAQKDIECANREYGSLINVAQLSYKYGMTERAHRYINRCHEDALIVDAKRRLYTIEENLSGIESAYEQLSKKQKSTIVSLNILLLVITGMLIATIMLLVLNLRKLKIANKAINDSMSVIREATRTNELFLGQFFTIFSNHIDALERYRSRLRVMAKNMDMDVIQKELRSNDFINQELDNLYEIFDRTFLGLFPNFMEQLNELLRPEERIQRTLPSGKLTNDIRILALIKLGMTDSKQIAKFLRLSTSTVFNYRVKYRNASMNGRESFEASLGTIHF